MPRVFRQKTGLCQIWRQDVGTGNQPPDLFLQFFRTGYIGLSIVAHHRIDDDRGIPRPESPDKIQNNLHLLLGAEKPHGNPVKGKCQLLPDFHNGLHLVG